MKNVQNRRYSLVETSGQFVLLDKRRGHYWQLNSVGALIYEKAASGDSADLIVESVLEKYDIEREVAEKDVKSMLTEFRKRKVFR